MTVWVFVCRIIVMLCIMCGCWAFGLSMICRFGFIYCTAVVLGQRSALHLSLEKGWNYIANKVCQCYIKVSFYSCDCWVYIPISGRVPFLRGLLAQTPRPFSQTQIQQTGITLREELCDITEEFTDHGSSTKAWDTGKSQQWNEFVPLQGLNIKQLG